MPGFGGEINLPIQNRENPFEIRGVTEQPHHHLRTQSSSQEEMKLNAGWILRMRGLEGEINLSKAPKTH